MSSTHAVHARDFVHDALASFSSKSYGSFTQSAVMPSCDSTARMASVQS